MARLWLHIGLMKTGTTAMQAWCADHQDALFDRGFAYVRSSNKAPACGALADALAAGKPNADTLLAHVVKQVHWARDDGVRDILLSTENFSYIGPKAAERLIAALPGGLDLRLLIWLRRQDRYAEAVYKQAVKFNGNIGPMEPYIRRAVVPMLDYARLIDRWCTAFPALTPCPQIYAEAGETRPDSIRALMTAIERPELCPEDSADHRANLTPRAELIADYADVAHAQAGALRRANRRLMAELGDAASARGDLMPPALAEEIRAAYAASNESLRARFFPERATLFDPPQDSTPPELSDASDQRALFARYFAQETPS